jgi:sporulation protein YlmC with PRC-barrel domain
MMGTRPAFEREGYTDADYAALTAEDLQGAAVYDGNDENVGSVEELVLAADGAIEEAVLDVGGFLGIGAHSVAIPFDEMQVMTNAGGDDVRVYIDQTREQLEQRPEYSGG